MNEAIGKPLNRVDGRLKVTGKAPYAGDYHEPNLAHAVLFQSDIAAGTITGFDLKAARKVPGVVKIITFQNAPRLKPLKTPMGPGESFMPFQNNEVYYNGQHIGVVIANTLEAAQQAARLVKVSYKTAPAKLDLDKHLEDSYVISKMGTLGEINSQRGDVDEGLKSSEVTMNATYISPIENHNPMEPHATLAVFKKGEMKVYDATQGVAPTAKMLSQLFKVSFEKTLVVTKFMGGGFGCKGSLWPHEIIAVMAAQQTGRPVKLVLTRQQMFTGVGHRARTIQQIALGAKTTGELQAFKHIVINNTAVNKDYSERSAVPTPMLYQCDNLLAEHRLVKLNYQVPTFMRAPGECSGSFAIESAMDEMAYALKMDPVEFRLRNYADKDQKDKIPFSSKSLRQCYEVGMKQFNWSRRQATPGRVHEGEYLVGYGMATSTYPARRFPAKAHVELKDDGTAIVNSATQDLGTGTYTIMTQIAAEYLTIPVERVKFDLGLSSYPEAGVSGGSTTAASVGTAIKDACDAVHKEIAELAMKDKNSPLYKHKIEELAFTQGRIHLQSDKNTGEDFATLMKRNKKYSLSSNGNTPKDLNNKKFSTHSFGAQFVEVRVHPRTGEVRVSQMVGAFAAGTILNAKTARSQFMGGMIMGLGMGLMEATQPDLRSGRMTVKDLADYHVPISADVPKIDIIMVDEKDTEVNSLGAKGIGEIGIVGTAGAIANAVFNATGVRVRELPITPDKIIQGAQRLT